MSLFLLFFTFSICCFPFLLHSEIEMENDVEVLVEGVEDVEGDVDECVVYTSIHQLRQQFGDNSNSFFDGLDAKEARQLYHQLIPRCLSLADSDTGHGDNSDTATVSTTVTIISDNPSSTSSSASSVSQSSSSLSLQSMSTCERAKLAFTARKIAKQYSRERGSLFVSTKAKLFDLYRHQTTYGLDVYFMWNKKVGRATRNILATISDTKQRRIARQKMNTNCRIDIQQEKEIAAEKSIGVNVQPPQRKSKMWNDEHCRDVCQLILESSLRTNQWIDKVTGFKQLQKEQQKKHKKQEEQRKKKVYHNKNNNKKKTDL